ncbi:MAG TPA: DmsE family decaheme c-type cytochrome [Terriglobales bacterium]|nr:DmsE family decaheme c-type cytochrome [Terriglobales bacterium]
MAAWRTPQSLLAMAASAVLLAAGAVAQTPAQKNVVPASPAPQSQYVGSETCKGCHEDLYKNVEGTLHVQTFKLKDAAHQGCEGCHGPGAAHVEGGGDKSKIFVFPAAKSQEVSQRCLSCHEGKLEQRLFRQSPHNENGVSCTSCHSVHHSKKEYLLTAAQPAQCYSCHTEQRADFMKPFRHRVDEGLIKCTDCHNPHGTPRDRQLRSSPNQDLICTKCHADKRGPFVYEHEPVRVEGCTACHTPHSSVYPRMLLTARINTLCLQCHVQIPTGVHGPQNQYRSTCIICHNSIHGSNTSNIFFK